MTALPATQPGDWNEPSPGAVVLANRPLRTNVGLSRYGDDRWHLNQGIFERHATSVSLDFTAVPGEFLSFAKRYFWVLINRDEADEVRMRRNANARPALSTIGSIYKNIKVFLAFLSLRGIERISDVVDSDLDDYAQMLMASDNSIDQQHRLGGEVMRLWDHREMLAPEDRLQPQAPWQARSLRQVFGQARGEATNRTPRIHTDTMNPLLAWSLRFVEDFSVDIVPAVRAFRALPTRKGQVLARRAAGVSLTTEEIDARLNAYVERLCAAGEPLPGKRINGRLRPDYHHIGLRIDVNPQSLTTGPRRQRLDNSGLKLLDYAPIGTPLIGELDGAPWLDHPIAVDAAKTLYDSLVGACLVVISYLSGMRPGEVLNLERGCVSHDPSSGIWSVTAREWKGVKDAIGGKAVEGEARTFPWTVIEPVAKAIAVMEALHDDHYVFERPPSPVSEAQRAKHSTTGLRAAAANRLVNRFAEWVNTYCGERGRSDYIPPDPTEEALYLTRFRRTLAWHICRKPRGLVAASIQYGHVLTQITVGYGGNAASGFPSEYAFERVLARLDDLGEAHQRLQDGEHVSGPGAAAYRHRADQYERFQGAVLTSSRQARALLANPDLQIIEGRAMHCVPNPDQALCRNRTDLPNDTSTPDLTDCQAACLNIARTDTDIAELRERSSRLKVIVSDPLAPPLRVARDQRELDRLTAIIHEHEVSRNAKP